MLLIFIVALFAALVIVRLFIGQAKFGKLPSGEQLETIKKSPNYRDGKFQNLSETPDFTEGANLFSVLFEFFFQKSKRSKPKDLVPTQKTNLLALDPNENILVWFGHSSYFMQVDGKTFLVDPVLSGAASPVQSTTRSFRGADVYTTDDFPQIDFLLISHDHWDHLDYETVNKLKPKVQTVICGLGAGAHFDRWGFKKDMIMEKDWDETVDFGGGFVVHTTSARHFSGRGFKRNQSLWLSFVLQTPDKRIYIGGDSGYDGHFRSIGEKFGPFDLAILECGQYNKNWKYIHMLPEQWVPAAKDLKAKAAMPVHWGKFSLALHDWDEPVRMVSNLSKQGNLPLLTPMIGEKVNLDQIKTFENWWTNVE